MKRNKVECKVCGGRYSRSNIKRHKEKCDGKVKLPFIKRDNCKFCGVSFMKMNSSERANHSRWCINNPLRKHYQKINAKSLDLARKSGKINYQRISKKISDHHKNGTYDLAKERQKKNPYWLGRHHSKKSKELIREAALKSNHRRLVKSTREYKKLDGTIVKLDSSWEEMLAKRLDELNIEWHRPKFLIWEDNKNIKHHYFPDFYLPKYNLYLDPKNPQAAKVQSEKIKVLRNSYSNLIFLFNEKDIKNFSPVPARVF